MQCWSTSSYFWSQSNSFIWHKRGTSPIKLDPDWSKSIENCIFWLLRFPFFTWTFAILTWFLMLAWRAGRIHPFDFNSSFISISALANSFPTELKSVNALDWKETQNNDDSSFNCFRHVFRNSENRFTEGTPYLPRKSKDPNKIWVYSNKYQKLF